MFFTKYFILQNIIDLEIQKLQNIARNANTNHHRINSMYTYNQQIKSKNYKII